MTKIEEKMKSIVGDDYWDWYLEMFDDVIAENPGINIVDAHLEAHEILVGYMEAELSGLEGMAKEMRRDDKINDILGSNKA